MTDLTPLYGDTASDLRQLKDMLTGDTIAQRVLLMDGTDVPAVIVPKGWEVQHLHNETLLDRPTRKRGVVSFEAPGDFADYVLGHSHEGTTLWLIPSGNHLTMTAVLDDHDEAGAGWAQHRAQLDLRTSTAWQRILDAATPRKALSQRDFAELLDDLQDVIVEPAGTGMLELVDSLEGTATQKVIASNVTGHSVSVTVEAGQSVKSKGGLEIPTKITVHLQPYRHLEFAVRFQLRVRIVVTDGQLQFGLSIVKLDDLIERAQDALAAVVDNAIEHAVPVWRGMPR